MRRTVFLHIGEPKSGSSYLQARMWANRGFLRQHGILLPGRGPVDHYQAGSDLQGESIRDGGSRRPDAWQWLVDRIDASDARAAIISDERLARTRAAPVRRALDSLRTHDVRLILAVREFGGLAASEWQQVVKMGGTAALEDWLDRLVAGDLGQFWRTHDVGDVLRRWCLPREHVHLLVVPPGGADRDELWRRFASIVAAPEVLPTAAARSNASLGLDETELVRLMYERLEGPPVPLPIQSVVRGVVSRGTLSARDGARSIRLPAAYLPWMEEQAEQRKAVVASSGCRIIGDVDELGIDRSRFVTAIAQPESDRVLDAAVDVIDELTTRVERRRQRRFGLAPTAAPGHPTRAPARQVALSIRDALGGAWATGRDLRWRSGDPTGRRYCLLISPGATGSDHLRRSLQRHGELLSADGVGVAAAPEHRGQERRRGWRGLVRDATRSVHRTVVVAEPGLADATEDEIGDLLGRLDGADVELLYVARDLTTLLPAVWWEQVRSQPTPPWTEWLNTLIDDPAAAPWWRAHDLDSVLRRWRGVGVVHLLVYPNGTHADAALWQRLQSVVGWGVSAAPDGPTRSAGHSEVELLRRMRERPGTSPLGGVDRILKAIEPSGRVTFPERTRAWIEATTERRRVSATEGRADLVGDIQELEPPAAAFTDGPSEPTDAAVLDVAVQVSAALVDELASLRSRARSAPRARLVAGLRRLA